MNYTTDAVNKIKKSGELAFVAGIKREDCPCYPQSSAWRAWRRGWNEAKREEEQAAPKTDWELGDFRDVDNCLPNDESNWGEGDMQRDGVGG